MNILQVVPELKSGGVERGSVDFAKYLLQHGHHSVMVSAGGPLVQDLVKAGVIHYTLNVHRKDLFSMISQIKALCRIIETEKIDVVHARSRVPAWIAYFACRKTKTTFITTCHGIYSTHAFSRVMGWGKYVIAISNAVSRHMKEKFNVPYHRIRLIHRGVNLREFLTLDGKSGSQANDAEKKPGRVIGIVGRITPIKGHPVLLKAMARVVRVFPDAKLQIIGDSSRDRYRDELRLLVKKLNIENSVEFLGTRYDVPGLIRQMDLLVAPAVGEEAFGRVLIEAGACGVPVIASRIGGIVDVIDHGKNGILVPAGDPASLAESMIGLLRETDYAKRLAKALKAKVIQKFNDERMFEETLQVYRDATQVKKILVIKLSALGDVILSTPTIRLLRKKYPQAKIVALVERPSRSILRQCPYLDDVWTIEKETGLKKWSQVFRLGKLLSKEYFDLCVDLQNSRFSHLLSLLSGAHTRIGYANGKWDLCLNVKTVDDATQIDPVQHQFRALKKMDQVYKNGAPSFEELMSHDADSLELWSDDANDRDIQGFLKDNWLGENQVLIGMNPGASPQWGTKQWPLEYFVELCDKLSTDNMRVVITGTQHDLPLAREIVRLSKSKPILACGKTSVSELVSLIKRCDVFVTSDSAPMHIASSTKTPFVALFGPTDPRRHVHAKENYKIIWKEIQCSPCYLKKCPIGLTCLRSISVDEVKQAIVELLPARKLASAAPSA